MPPLSNNNLTNNEEEIMTNQKEATQLEANQKEPKLKLTVTKETIADLDVQDAAHVKGGDNHTTTSVCCRDCGSAIGTANGLKKKG